MLFINWTNNPKLEPYPFNIKHKLLGYNEEYSFSSDESLIKWVRENLALKKPFRFRY